MKDAPFIDFDKWDAENEAYNAKFEAAFNELVDSFEYELELFTEQINGGDYDVEFTDDDIIEAFQEFLIKRSSKKMGEGIKKLQKIPDLISQAIDEYWSGK